MKCMAVFVVVALLTSKSGYAWAGSNTNLFVVYSVAGIPAPPAALLTWHDAACSPIFNGKFSDATAPEGTQSFLASGPSCAWFGWGVFTNLDMRAFSGGELRFFLKSTTDLELQLEGPKNTKGSIVVPSTGGQWLEVANPISVFTAQGVDLSKLYGLFLITATNGHTAFYVDYVRWVNVSTTTDLVVQTNGLCPAPSAKVVSLQVNQAYAFTAGKYTGYAFTNWTDGTGQSLTNGQTLQFVMTSNLVFQANYVDIAKPIVKITSPKPGQRSSNAVVQVTGTVTDNGCVASIYCQLNNGPWQQLAGATNWSTTVTPTTPGLNTVSAYAVDAAGNVSATTTVTFTNVVVAQLCVAINGNGSVNPNYNGKYLEIGQTYAMTATPAVNFRFTNWSGSLTTNSRTLKFVMASNLCFTANFVDAKPPTLIVTSPTRGQRVSNAVFTVTGKASDNVAVSNVFYMLNTGAWTVASTTNGWTNWFAIVNLLPGTNVLRAYAVDGAGNVSPTTNIAFTSVSLAPVAVHIIGAGTVIPNYDGQWLELGKTYSMTAKAALGFGFAGWTGSLPTNAATLKFMMASNLTFTANFVDVSNPVVTVISPKQNQIISNSVFTVTGTARDNVSVSEVWYRINADAWASASSTNGWTNWTATVNLLPGTNRIWVCAVDSSGNISKTNSTTFTAVFDHVEPLYGLDFSPYLEGQDPNLGTQISIEQIQQRMSPLTNYTKWIRSYGCTHGLENIGQVAKGMGFKTAIGAWLSTDPNANEIEITNLIQVAKQGYVDLAIVGSETLLRGDLTENELLGYITLVKQALPGIPVTTADTYLQWLSHTNLMAAVDVALVNYYPFWEGTALSNAVRALNGWQMWMTNAAAGKPVIVSETGWPSAGNAVGSAVPSPENASFYFLNFVSWAHANDVPYFYFEAFDESWKAASEGPQGAHWGIWDTNAVLKSGMAAVFSGERLPDNWSGSATPGGPGTPSIEFTSVPVYGTFNNLQGRVLHVPWTDYAVVVYIYVNGWWVKPTFANPLTLLTVDGSWTCDVTTGGIDQFATAYAAFVVPIGYSPPLLGGAASLPSLLGNPAVTEVYVTR